MKPSCRWPKGLRGKRTKNSDFFLQGYGPDKSDIAGRLFVQFLEILPPISVCSLSHLKCTMLGEGTQIKNKNEVCQKTEEPSSHLGFPMVLAVV